MRHLFEAIQRSARRYGRTNDRGASLVEYALLVSLIAIACVAAVSVFGAETSETFSRVGNSVSQT